MYASRVDGVGEAGGRAQAGGAVGALGQPAQLLDPSDVRPIDADGVLALLLRHVEGAVGDADEVGALDAVLRIGGDAADMLRNSPLSRGFSARRSMTERAIERPSCSSRRASRRANSSPPSRKASPPWRRRVATCARTRSPIGWPCRSLTCLKLSMSSRTSVSEPLVLCLVQVVLEALVEVAVVAEPGEGVGERQAHRLQRAVHRALVERDGDERADEGRGEERRALPEDGQHEADRGHDREGNDRPVDRALEQRHERLARPARDDARRQRDVDGVEGRRGEDDLDEEPADAVVGADERGGCACRSAAECVDGAVVGEPDGRAALDELDGRPGDEADDDRRLPAVDDGRADDEDSGEETPPDEIPSIGTGYASTNVAATASASMPPSMAMLGAESRVRPPQQRVPRRPPAQRVLEAEEAGRSLSKPPASPLHPTRSRASESDVPSPDWFTSASLRPRQERRRGRWPQRAGTPAWTSNAASDLPIDNRTPDVTKYPGHRAVHIPRTRDWSKPLLIPRKGHLRGPTRDPLRGAAGGPTRSGRRTTR